MGGVLCCEVMRCRQKETQRLGCVVVRLVGYCFVIGSSRAFSWALSVP
ncbi:Uncharacterised protein [Vibrio cholerae]|nr:Uncharacterised protein [Vibrio cholerae]